MAELAVVVQRYYGDRPYPSEEKKLGSTQSESPFCPVSRTAKKTSTHNAPRAVRLTDESASLVQRHMPPPRSACAFPKMVLAQNEAGMRIPLSLRPDHSATLVLETVATQQIGAFDRPRSVWKA